MSKMSRSQKNNFVDENQSCSPFQSVQDAPIIKLWKPLFDGFVDILILMIWGSLGVVWLDWQIWPSGRELGSPPQGPCSIPPSPLMGFMWDPCGIPVGSNLCASRRRTLRGLFFTKKFLLKMRNKVCLLYTSPSPRDPKTSRMPSSA